jgi:CheY-like chemotaxis protein
MSRRILLADDSVTIQKVIELTFMDEDFEVRAVSNGDEALALLPDFRPEFVIADVHMPGANGYEVCRRAKALLPNVPVLLLVGTFEPFDEGQSRSSGADSFLKKPFDSQELLQRVQTLLGSASPAPAAASAPSPTFGAATAFPPGPTAAPYPPGPTAVPSSPFAEPEPSFELPSLGPDFSVATPDFGAPSALNAEAPIWGSLDLEAPAVESPSPFADEAPLTLLDDQPFALEDERPALSFEDDRAFALEDEGALSLDEPLTFREEPAEELSFSYDPPQDRFLDEIERPVSVETPMSTTPPEPEYSWATDEERLGVPIGAAPLVDSLEETEERIHAAPSYQTGGPTGSIGGIAAHEPASPFAAGTEAYAPQVPASAPLQVGYTESYSGNGSGSLSDSDIDRIARRMVELLGEKVVRDIAWEVIPDLAEVVIKERLRELESQA